ncbi:PHP domain-containing protein [Acetohalobium arabaticum]|uniref:PHP domain protein n=1 Tax=Acetohalobium arabaticum (strain ATCC 49924 / DSM 5501 / Z-7288) TaxID=574087 RepID=D9QS25_ACEAZ|nr:PHP domain-containing protein [Acetohalobium arabaticum]ADL13316.1 PHP domain protein [Acetohalobium arabaticum DSM 5501]
MIEYLADLHVHTVLSPCGDLIMTPQNIIQTAEAKGIDILAITDHNSAENLEVALKLAKSSTVNIIPGMEIETKEEIHLITLFSDLKAVMSFQKLVYSHLPPVDNDEEVFGPQLITDEKDQFIDRIEQLLLISTDLSLEETVAEVEKRGGIIFPAHVDKKEYSILTSLGFIPEEVNFSVLEISKFCSQIELYNKFPTAESYRLIKSSDAHYISDIAPHIKFKLKAPILSEINLAFKGDKDRKVVINK